MGWFTNWIIKRKTERSVSDAFKEEPPMEFYERNLPLERQSVRDLIISDSYDRAVSHILFHVQWHISDVKLTCTYCNTKVNFLDHEPQISISMRQITVYHDPPYDAKDLRIVFLKGWMANISHSGIKIPCPTCGHLLEINDDRWSVGDPKYGSTKFYNFL